MNILLLMMGGNGTRFGGEIPKQYVEVNGHPIFYYIARGYAIMKEIGAICVVSNPLWLDFTKVRVADIPFNKPLFFVTGGHTRSESVRNGLAALRDIASPNDVVLIHDATHPYVDQSGTLAVIRAVHECGGATLGSYAYDTCYETDERQMVRRVVERRNYVAGASPEAFRYGEISRICFESSEEELERMSSVGAIALAHGIPVQVIPSKTLNLKITYPEDLVLFRVLANSYYFKGEGQENI